MNLKMNVSLIMSMNCDIHHLVHSALGMYLCIRAKVRVDIWFGLALGTVERLIDW